MKRIDRYLLKSYLTRLVGVFAICMLIFVVQTFWLYVDELAGKGLDLSIIFRFLMYYSPKLVPLVLPLSVLLAALMTYGTLAENYEFAAMKSSGISLFRAMIALVFFHIALGIGSFYFSNYVIPYGEVKYFNLRKNLAKLKPALAIREGMFNDLGGYNIKVNRKYGDNERFLEDVIIHEKSLDKRNNIVIKAKRGELKNGSFESVLQLVLFDGYRYEEVKPDKPRDQVRYPHNKVAFKEYTMNIDLSQFNNVDLDEENYTSTYRMQRIDQLNKSIDTLETNYNEERTVFSENFSKESSFSTVKSYSAKQTPPDSLQKADVLDFAATDETWRYLDIVKSGMVYLRGDIRDLENKKRLFFLNQKLINLHKITRDDKYALIFASLVLFFIGASLGAIIRKGGLGLPLVLAILIFLTYHYIGLFAKNAAEDNSIAPTLASWLSTLIMTPFALYLTRRATADKGFFDIDSWLLPLTQAYKKIVEKTPLKRYVRKV
jgi:lipopolysaccharide export system permease protein